MSRHCSGWKQCAVLAQAPRWHGACGAVAASRAASTLDAVISPLLGSLCTKHNHLPSSVLKPSPPHLPPPPRDAIIQRVHKQHLRPHLPSATPSDYRDLALRCWAHDPAARPTFDEIVLELTRMAEALDADGSVASEQSQGASASAEQQPRQGPGGVQPPQKQLRPDLQQQQLLADQHAAAAMLAARRAPGSRRSTARSGARADA